MSDHAAQPHPLASAKPPENPAISESTIRAIRRLPELVALAREIAGWAFCHRRPVACPRCESIIRARAIVEGIDTLTGETADPGREGT